MKVSGHDGFLPIFLCFISPGKPPLKEWLSRFLLCTWQGSSFPFFCIALLMRSTSPSSWFPYRVTWLFLVQLQNQGAHFQCSRGSKARCLSKTLEHLSGQRKPLAKLLQKEPEGTLPSSLQHASSFYRGRLKPRGGRCVACSHIASLWLEPWSPGLWLWALHCLSSSEFSWLLNSWRLVTSCLCASSSLAGKCRVFTMWRTLRLGFASVGQIWVFVFFLTAFIRMFWIISYFKSFSNCPKQCS